MKPDGKGRGKQKHDNKRLKERLPDKAACCLIQSGWGFCIYQVKLLNQIDNIYERIGDYVSNFFSNFLATGSSSFLRDAGSL